MPVDLMDDKRPVMNEYSQFGEDGLLNAIFAELGTLRGTLVEVGAWNGKYLSNCYSLLTQGWTGIHIEADEARTVELTENVSKFGSAAICEWVGPAGKPLSQILDEAGCRDHIDLLSIDIDSDDLAVFSDFCTGRRADVVCIEFNPTIPNDVYFMNTSGETWGNSALAISDEALRQGYQLVAFTFCNLIFVSMHLAEGKFKTQSITTPGASGQLRTWWGYDGSIFMAKIGDAHTDSQIKPPDLIIPPWGQPSFAQPVAAVDRVWPSLANDALTAERDSLIRDRDALAVHAEALAAERDGLVADRDVWVTHAEALAAERDALVADRDVWVTHAEALAVERDALVADRDAHSA